MDHTPPLSPALRRLGAAGPNDAEMELIRAATLDGDAAASAWRRWLQRRDIDTAHHRSTDLLPAVSANLPAEVVGADADRMRGLRRRVWAENELVVQGLIDAVAVLAAAGIDVTVVKGVALTTTVYREPGTRHMADADLVVGPRDFVAACDALIGAGWRMPHPIYPFFHASELVDPNGRAVDVHRWVVFPRFSPVPETAWFERTVPHQIRRAAVHRLTSADELVLTCLHGLLTNTVSATRWPIDVVRTVEFAGRDEPDFWDHVVRASGEVAAGPVVADALEMCRVELTADIPADVVDALHASRVDRGLASHWLLCRRGITPEWRLRRYVRIERVSGRRPTVRRYLAPRIASFRARGPADVARGRLERCRDIMSKRRRD